MPYKEKNTRIMLQIVRPTLKSIPNISHYVKFPERLKGTIFEKLANYWKNLFIDYKQMLQDLRSDMQEEPKKAFTWITGLTTAYLLAKSNPTEIDFKSEMKAITNEIILVNEECVNPKSIEHLRFIQNCYNGEVIHYKSIGIASFMYLSKFNDSCDLYKSQCSYLQPSFMDFPSRIIDFGIMGKWWNLHIKSTNYDINF